MQRSVRRDGFRSQLEQIILTEPIVTVDLLTEYPDDTDRRTWKICNYQGYEQQRAKLKVLWSEDGIMGNVATFWVAPLAVAQLPTCAMVACGNLFTIPSQLDLKTPFRAMRNEIVVSFMLFPAEF